MKSISLEFLVSSEAVLESLILQLSNGACHYFFTFPRDSKLQPRNEGCIDLEFLCAHCSERVYINLPKDYWDPVLSTVRSLQCEHLFKVLDDEMIPADEWLVLSKGGCELPANQFTRFMESFYTGANDQAVSLMCSLCGFNINLRKGTQYLSEYLETVLQGYTTKDIVYYLYALRKYVMGFIEDSKRPMNSENKIFIKVFKDVQILCVNP